MEDLYKENSEKIRVFLGKETIKDPYSKRVDKSFLPSIVLDAIVSDVSFTTIQYGMPGIVADEAKQIIIDKRHRNLIELSQKIKIRNSYYNGYRINGKMKIKREDDKIRIYVYIKKEE